MSTSKKRIQLIDGLCGFSLAGIVLANMLAFQYGIFGQSKPQLFGIGGADQAFHSFLHIAVVGSFMPIFAFMFGFGMIKLSESIKSRDLRPKCHLAPVLRSTRFLPADVPESEAQNAAHLDGTASCRSRAAWSPGIQSKS
ncbi:hypothetical protein [Paenibacillus sp.]